jgi:hypothetical protein
VEAEEEGALSPRLRIEGLMDSGIGELRDSGIGEFWNSRIRNSIIPKSKDLRAWGPMLKALGGVGPRSEEMGERVSFTFWPPPQTLSNVGVMEYWSTGVMV